jgi:hypothetical protein
LYLAAAALQSCFHCSHSLVVLHCPIVSIIWQGGGGGDFGYDEEEEVGAAAAAADDDELYRRRPIDQEEEVRSPAVQHSSVWFNGCKQFGICTVCVHDMLVCSGVFLHCIGL